MKRAMWIVNHKALLPAEVPLLRELGYEVYIPKLVPQDAAYSSDVISYDYDDALKLPSTALQLLNAHEFYYRKWSPSLTRIINDNFDVIISSFSDYSTPLFE